MAEIPTEHTNYSHSQQTQPETVVNAVHSLIARVSVTISETSFYEKIPLSVFSLPQRVSLAQQQLCNAKWEKQKRHSVQPIIYLSH